MRLTHHQIAPMPAAYITATCTIPLYQGLISETYFARNLRWRSVIMGGPRCADGMDDGPVVIPSALSTFG